MPTLTTNRYIQYTTDTWRQRKRGGKIGRNKKRDPDFDPFHVGRRIEPGTQLCPPSSDRCNARGYFHGRTDRCAGTRICACLTGDALSLWHSRRPHAAAVCRPCCKHSTLV